MMVMQPRLGGGGATTCAFSPFFTIFHQIFTHFHPFLSFGGRDHNQIQFLPKTPSSL